MTDRPHGELMRIVSENLPEAVVVLGADAKVSYWNPAAERLFGYDAAEARGRGIWELILAPWAEPPSPESCQSQQFELDGCDRDGRELKLLVTPADIRLDEEFYTQLHLRDVSAQEEGRRLTSEDARLLAEAQRIARFGMWVVDFVDGDIVRSHWSPELYHLLEIDDPNTPASVETFISRVHPQDRGFASLVRAEQDPTAAPWQINYRLQMPDGRLKHVAEASQVVTDSAESGRRRRLITLAENTEFTLMEEQLADRAYQQETVVELGMVALGESSVLQKLRTIVSRSAEVLKVEYGEICEYSPSTEKLAPQAAAGWGEVSEGLRDALERQAFYTIATDEPVLVTDAAREGEFDGQAELAELGIGASICIPIKSASGVYGVLSFHSRERKVFGHDVVHYLMAVANMVAAVIEDHRSRARLQISAEIFNSSEPIFVTDADGVIVEANQAFLRAYGYAGEEIIGLHADILDVDDVDRSVPAFQELRTKRTWSGEVMHRTKTQTIPVLVTITRIESAEGGITNFIVHVTDLTDMRKKDQELQHALRMDAVGQLSSGVAHDFNNLLGIIDGNLRFIRELCDDEPDTVGMFEDAFSAIRDGSALTSRLLSFSHALPESTRVVEIHEVVDSIEGFLSRALGSEIEISSIHQAGAANISVDVSALESAMLNLAINARDAMPQGGELTIVARVEQLALENPEGYRIPAAGEYAIISLSDTGTGIDPSTLPFVFDPFFTTKGHGKGNGLGLSMVQNFLVASGGTGHIASELGVGTTVSLVIPTSDERATEQQSGAAPTIVASTGQESVLVVEDEPRLRRIVVRQLQSLDYQVQEVETADMARKVIESGAQLNLVFSDVMMPGEMDGQDLAVWLRETHPNIKVLLTSGHSKVNSAEFNRDIEDFALLRKPFTKAALAEAVRQALDAA